MASLKQKILALAETEGASAVFVQNSFAPLYHKDSVQKALKGLREVGLVVEGAEELALSSLGRQALSQASPFFANREQKWDGLWRLVFFDFPETSRDLRDRFRRELRQRGFGLWQSSVWVSPFNHDFFDKPEILEPAIRRRLELIKGIRISASDEREMADSIWGLKGLNKSYLDVYNKWQEHFTEVGTQDWKGLRSLAGELQDRYLSLLFEDPGLPGELLPEGYKREPLAEVGWQWRHLLKR